MRYSFERDRHAEGFDLVIGCDEVGRGALAGPVVAAAVAFPKEVFTVKQPRWFPKVADSKVLSPHLRAELAPRIRARALWAIGEADAATVDRINVHRAVQLAMHRALVQVLGAVPCGAEKLFLVVDGKFELPHCHLKQTAVVGGDGKIFSVAAASIVAKVYRDGLMVRLGSEAEPYGFARHKGYGTPAHLSALRAYGLSAFHRRTFCGG